MLNWVFLLLFIFSNVYASDYNERRDKILEIVTEELKEAQRLADQYNGQNPDLLLRVAELNMEKGRLYREEENEKYLKIDAEKRRGLTKSDYFKKSSQYFETANRNAVQLTNRFKNYKDMSEVYYILAYNAKELGQYKKSEEYFALAAQKSKKGTKVNDRSKLALADTHFNNKRFKDAIPLYESALKNLDETWWTKDSFNLAWCYYRVGQFSKAINKMKQVHDKSKSKKYINIQNFVERDIGLFYVEAGMINEGIKYYKEIGINFSKHLAVIAASLVPQGKFTQAETLFDEAIKMEKDPQKKSEIQLAQLDLFDKYGKNERHLAVSKELVGYHLKVKFDPDSLKKLNYHVAKKAAELQKTAAGDLYIRVPKTRTLKAEQAIAYFSLQDQIAGTKKAQTIFYQGETWYSIGEYGKAIKLYIEAFDLAVETKESKILDQSLEGMLSSLGQSDLSPKVAESYYIPVYTRYLKKDKKSEKAVSIYKKLYKVHIDKGDLVQAEAVLAEFSQNHPSDFKTQEAMLAGIMESYRKSKNYPALKNLIRDIDAGKYKVSKTYADKLRQLLTSIQMDDAEKSLAKGEKSQALESYLRIYNDKDSTTNALSNAAYNLSALYYEAGDMAASQKWAVIALDKMSSKEVIPFTESFLTISTGLFLRQELKNSADLSVNVLFKICQENVHTKNIAFKNAIFLYLAENQKDLAFDLLVKAEKCGLNADVINEARVEIAKEYVDDKSWTRAESVIIPATNSTTFAPHTLTVLSDLRSAYRNVGDDAKVQEYSQKINKIIATAQAQKVDIPVEVLKSSAQPSINRIKSKYKELRDSPLTFPEDIFNNQVKKKLALLESIEKDVKEVQATGSGEAIVESAWLKIVCFETFSKELQQFIPEGKGDDYLTSFRKAMSSIYQPLANNAATLRREINDIIIKNKILSIHNHDLLNREKNTFYFYNSPFVVMDRAGKQ